MRLQKEANSRIAELSEKAHSEAVRYGPSNSVIIGRALNWSSGPINNIILETWTLEQGKFITRMCV